MANSSNSGVEGGSGYSFQKCCVVLLLLEGINELKKKNYFICVEHYDDFLFGFLSDSGELKSIDTYQAKKSNSDWGTDLKLCEIIGKITEVGCDIMNDKLPKHSAYYQTLTFITNRNIKLAGKDVESKKQAKIKVQAKNDCVSYSSLDIAIKDNIKSKICSKYNSFSSELTNVKFQVVDLPQTHQGWKRILESLSRETFGNKIEDHEATITTLIKLLQDVELTYNQNDIILLSDHSKRLTKDKIESTFSILKEYKKSFNFWRRYSDELSKKLSINLPYQRRAEVLLQNCFDYFKDLKQPEYRKIYKFVRDSIHIDEKHSSESDCIYEIYNKYISENKVRLERHMVAFSVVAAYVESRGIDG